MSGPERMSFAAYADPERPAEQPPPAAPPVRSPSPPAVATKPPLAASVPVGEIWNPCGGYYAIHRCAQRGCDTSKCKRNGRQFLVRCPGRSQAPYVWKGHSLYKFAQCVSCQERERAEATP